MSTFDKMMSDYQAEWRKINIKSKENGVQNGKQHDWILRPDLWEDGLWEGIRSDTNNSLPGYLNKQRVQKHLGSHNLKSSWMLCANLYFPFRATGSSRNLLAGFLSKHVSADVSSVDDVELEYAEEVGDPLHPARLLGEQGGSRGAGQTSPDLAFIVNNGKGLILVENKFVEHSFYPCSARKRTGSDERPGNPDPDRCKDPLAVLNDPEALCHQVAWARRYWDHLKPVIDEKKMASLNCCPAAYAGYQLFRQQALAEGIAAFGKYDFVVSCLAVDYRNDTLRSCLNSTGLNDICDWGTLFNGKARFSVFTHQQWVAWVRDNDHVGYWEQWLNYIRSRYDLS